MKYEGSLYAKVNGRYLRLEYNTDQFDKMHEALKKSAYLLKTHGLADSVFLDNLYSLLKRN